MNNVPVTDTSALNASLTSTPTPPLRASFSQRLKRLLFAMGRSMARLNVAAATLALSILILAAFIPELGDGRVVLGGGLDVPLSEITQHGLLATLGVWLVLTIVVIIVGAALLFAAVVSLLALALSLFVAAVAMIVPGLILLMPVAVIAWTAFALGRRSIRTGVAV